MTTSLPRDGAGPAAGRCGGLTHGASEADTVDARGRGDVAGAGGKGNAGGAEDAGSVKEAPQNLQNCAAASHAPRHRPHTRAAATGSARIPISTTGVGAMRERISGAGAVEMGRGARTEGEAGRCVGGAPIGAGMDPPTRPLPHVVQWRIPWAFIVPQLKHRTLLGLMASAGSGGLGVN